MCWSKLFGKSGQEKGSPGDWLPRDAFIWHGGVGVLEIDLYKLHVILDKLPQVLVTHLADTNSMDPVMDSESNVVLISGSNPGDQKKLVDALRVGDVTVYKTDKVPLVIHRVVAIKQDQSGRYFTFRGDNNTVDDAERVRDEAIAFVCVGILY